MIHLVPLASNRILCGRSIPLGEDVDSAYGELHSPREDYCPDCLAAADDLTGFADWSGSAADHEDQARRDLAAERAADYDS